jgi:hypothetical protein
MKNPFHIGPRLPRHKTSEEYMEEYENGFVWLAKEFRDMCRQARGHLGVDYIDICYKGILVNHLRGNEK